MRFAALLILAAAANAQPPITNEVIWRTTPVAPGYVVAPRAAPVAADGDGFVVAWSEMDGVLRAYAGRRSAICNRCDAVMLGSERGASAGFSPPGFRAAARQLQR